MSPSDTKRTWPSPLATEVEKLAADQKKVGAHATKTIADANAKLVTVSAQQAGLNSKVEPLKKLYDGYSFGILPALGALVADDADSYRYLAESIRKHPDQESLAEMMKQAGLQQVGYQNLTGGIVAIHRGTHG